MAGLRCGVVRAQLDDLLDERLARARQERVLAHLRDCAACSAEWQALRQVRESLRRSPAEPLPDGFAERLHRRLVAAGATSAAARPRTWGRVAMPAATALLGFFAAAALAAPLLTPAPQGTASGASSCCLAGIMAPVRQSLHPTGPAALEVASAATAGAAASSTPEGSSSASSSAGAIGGTVHNGAAALVPGAVKPGSGTPAVALTLVATSPPVAVEGLTTAAAQAGGTVSALPGGPAHPASGTAPTVATMDIVVPAPAASTFVQGAAHYGTVLASAGALPAASASGSSVRVLVTVLESSPPPVAQAQAAAPAPSGRTAGASAVAEHVLLRAGRRAPLGAGAVLVGLGIWLSFAWLRRPPLP